MALLVTQLFLIAFGFAAFWEGSKGFRSTGIRIGLVKSDGKPITGTKGKVIGSLMILLGLVSLLVALVYIPFFG